MCRNFLPLGQNPIVFVIRQPVARHRLPYRPHLQRRLLASPSAAAPEQSEQAALLALFQEGMDILRPASTAVRAGHGGQAEFFMYRDGVEKLLGALTVAQGAAGAGREYRADLRRRITVSFNRFAICFYVHINIHGTI